MAPKTGGILAETGDKGRSPLVQNGRTKEEPRQNFWQTATRKDEEDDEDDETGEEDEEASRGCCGKAPTTTRTARRTTQDEEETTQGFAGRAWIPKRAIKRPHRPTLVRDDVGRSGEVELAFQAARFVNRSTIPLLIC